MTTNVPAQNFWAKAISRFQGKSAQAELVTKGKRFVIFSYSIPERTRSTIRSKRGPFIARARFRRIAHAFGKLP
jgi:hypothetical protein